MIDVGAGDGRFALRTATAEPETFVVAIDANAAALADGVGRARKARLANILFAVASAHALPPELDGVADAVHVHFPWGSLLTAVLGGDGPVVGGLVRMLRPGGELTIVASVIERDGVPEIPRLDSIAAGAVVGRIVAAAAGDLAVVEHREAGPDDLAATHSTWAKRLGVGRSRPAWILSFVRAYDGGRPKETPVRTSDSSHSRRAVVGSPAAAAVDTRFG